jgi:peroxiredoxin
MLVMTAIGQQKVGSLAETFNGVTLDGEEFVLDDLRGRVVVMTFWSTKCAICHEEIPKLNKLVDKYAGRDVVMMGLSMEHETKISLYLQKKPFKFTIVPNSLGVILKYADRDNRGNPNMGFPSYFIIDQEGQLVYKSNGWDKTGKIDSEVSRLLGASTAKDKSDNQKGKTK